jgi:hypothetical protein
VTPAVSLYESYAGELALIRERDGLGYCDMEYSLASFASDADACWRGRLDGNPITREDVDRPLTIVMRNGRARGRGRKHDVSERIPIDDPRTMRGWAKVAEWSPSGGVSVIRDLGAAASSYVGSR